MTQRPRLGAAYYHEYQPTPRLRADLDLMAEAGIAVIRVGESVWSTWEPRDNEFDLDWLTPVLDGAHERGIEVILGTPTYAIPPWLQRAHPEFAAHRPDGTPVPWGARQEVDITNPDFRHYAERVIRRILTHHAQHPAIIGYQVDNEPGLLLPHNAGVFAGFKDQLRTRFGEVATLNREWGLTYWSHRLSDWDDLWPPAGNTTPSYDLAWRRYQAELTTDFIRWQADLVRELGRADQFVTTCLAYSRPAVDDVALTANLDITAGNAYFATQDALARPDPTLRLDSTWFGHGAWSVFLAADRMRGSRQEPFLVTETNATSIAGAHVNHPPYAGQLRQLAFALVARGARLVEYWHWHSLHFGHETYWGGILGHSLTPGRSYAEIQSLANDLAHAGDQLADLTPDADVAFLHSLDSKWAFQHQPPLATAGHTPDPRAYERVFDTCYQAFFDANLRATILSPSQLPTTDLPPVLVVPALYILDDTTAARLTAYAESGGHLVLTFRTGYADDQARARAELAPGPLRRTAGVHYSEFSNLTAPIPIHSDRLTLPASAHATAWADALIVDDADPIASYDHPHFGQWPAATTRRCGTGRVTYLGTLPDPGFARALAHFVADAAGRRTPWTAIPDSVTVTSAVNAAGIRIWFLHNWSWHPAELPAPTNLTDVLTGRPLPAGTPVTLASWDVRVLAELTPAE